MTLWVGNLDWAQLGDASGLGWVHAHIYCRMLVPASGGLGGCPLAHERGRGNVVSNLLGRLIQTHSQGNLAEVPENQQPRATTPEAQALNGYVTASYWPKQVTELARNSGVKK